MRSLIVLVAVFGCQASQIVENPYVGITLITRTETSPRPENMHIAEIDLTAPGIGFKLAPPGGTLETVRQTTLNYLNQEHAQLAINSHFFLPFPSTDPNAMLIGLAASNGNVYSAFESPVQSYAIVTNAPGLNIDPANHASIVHADTTFADGKHVQESVTLWNAVTGSAQIVTNGLKTIPTYVDATHPDGLLTPGGPANYSNSNSWYDLTNARTVIGLSQDNRTLFLFTVDNAGGSRGMTLGEIATLLIQDYGVYNALNLDGGGSTSMAIQDAATGTGRFVNVSSDNPNGRAEGSNLAVFAIAVPEPTSLAYVTGALFIVVLLRIRNRRFHAEK
jgi:phosphodiester glycosidase